jgi:hypothetical protein
MAKKADYQDDDVVIMSRNPLKGKLLLITDDDEEIELQIDKESAEALMSALGAFLVEGVIGPLSPSCRTRQRAFQPAAESAPPVLAPAACGGLPPQDERRTQSH